MQERVNIENSAGPVHLEGDKNDSVLYLKNVPVQFTYLREIGSTWRYQIARSIHEGDIIEDRHFSNFVRFGHLTNDALAKQFEYILNQLSPGDYQLEMDFLPQELYIVESQAVKDRYYLNDDYGGLEDIIETQSTIEEQTVQEYVRLIEQGEEPIIIVFTCFQSRNKFILDGHHKFIAYKRLNKQARALLITKLGCRKITKEKGLALLDLCKCENKEYKNRFLQRFKFRL